MTPPGARWITCHPNGPDEEGRPVLIRDDGSGTVLAGMGGKFNGQRLGALYDRDSKEPEGAKEPQAEPAKADAEPQAEPSNQEAHPRYNEHTSEYEDLGPELQAHVYGVPEHGGEGQGWRFHLRNPHLEEMARAGYGALPGGLLLPHKEGGVVYSQHAGDKDDYESAVHSMATDVSSQIHEHLGREHERRMRDEEQKAYQEETERELAAWRREQQAGVRKAIARFGGIARFRDTDAKGRRYMDSEYNDYIPKWARNQKGLTPDRARHALNEEFPHLGLQTPSDLFDYMDQFEDERASFKEQQREERGKREGLKAARAAERAEQAAARQTPVHDPEFDKYAGIVLRRVWSAPAGTYGRREFSRVYGPEMVGHLVKEGLLRAPGANLSVTPAGIAVARGAQPVPPRRGQQAPYVFPDERPNVAPSYDPQHSHTRRYYDRTDADADILNYFEGRDQARGDWDRSVRPTLKLHDYEKEGDRLISVRSHHYRGEAVTTRERPSYGSDFSEPKIEATFPTPNPYGGDLDERATEGAARRRASRLADEADEAHGQVAYPRGGQTSGGLPQLLDHPAAQEYAARTGMTDSEGRPYDRRTHLVAQPYAGARMGFLGPDRVVPREDKHEEFDVPRYYEVPEDADRARRKLTRKEARRAAAREGDSTTMPYDSNDDLPPAAKDKLSAHQQEVFRAAFNNALKEYGDESKAYAVAWAAAKKASGGDDRESRESGGIAPIPDGPHVWTEAQERPVRESTVQPQSVRANIVREGRGYRIRDCQLMSAGSGNSLHGNTYEPEAIQALVPEVKRQSFAYIDHSLPSEVRERGHRSLKDLAGVYDKRTVRYDPQSQACLADLIVRPTVYDEYVAPVLEAGDNLGISVDGIGHCPDQPRHVKGWKRFNSADLVPAGGARGFIVREANTPQEKRAEKEFAMSLFDDVSATDVRESAPALFEEIGRQYATVRASGAASPDAQTAVPPPAPDDGRLAGLETRVREAEQRAEAADARVYELEAETNRRAVADFVGAMVRECGLVEDKQAAFVAKRFAGATMGPEGTYSDQASLEAAVREAAEEFKSVLPSVPSGQIVGLGSGSAGGKFTAPKTNDSAIVTAMDRLFGAPSVTFPAAPASNGQPAPNGAGGQ